ncbi:hypothetical protein [Petroclostridium sp. X23]|uniref:hypothetical protein n=1 Tax=Petroclostridium sp. X23 TaxID=3045146 RepID=UPI0024ADB582|nr:hypothetical protein [Petroclostridium sp. X23]WHH58561.1 hypothetical protein QKW49_22640 [Petroclostridium sp. X23]
MRVENYNTFTQSRRLYSTGKIGNVPLPNYNEFNFNTKKASAMSDEKYREAIIEQAQKDQSAGKFQSESAGFRSLVKSYVSVVSPDRKNIITAGLTAIFKNNKPQPKTLNLIDYLFGNVKYCKEATDVSYAEFYDSNGEMVASYSNGRWISYGTKAEHARESELWGIYNEAWNNAARVSQGNSHVVNTDTTLGLIDKSV